MRFACTEVVVVVSIHIHIRNRRVSTVREITELCVPPGAAGRDWGSLAIQHRVINMVRWSGRHRGGRRRWTSKSRRRWRGISISWRSFWNRKYWKLGRFPSTRFFIVLNSWFATRFHENSSVPVVVATWRSPIGKFGAFIGISRISVQLERSTETATSWLSLALSNILCVRKVVIVWPRGWLWRWTALVVIVNSIPRLPHRTRGSRRPWAWVWPFVVPKVASVLILCIIWHPLVRKWRSIYSIQVVSRFGHVSAAVVRWGSVSLISWKRHDWERLLPPRDRSLAGNIGFFRRVFDEISISPRALRGSCSANWTSPLRVIRISVQ